MHSPLSTVATLALATVWSCVLAQRSYDGQANNLNNPTWGSAGSPYAYFPQLQQRLRSLLPYEPLADLNQPLLTSRLPSPRDVSDSLARVPGDIEPETGPTSFRSVSALVTYWGEFIAQDLGHLRAGNEQRLQIPVGPPNQNRSMPFIRGAFQSQIPVTLTQPAVSAQVRTLTNDATSFLDASMIYGTSRQELATRISGFNLRMDQTRLQSGASVYLPQLYTNYNKAEEFTVLVNLTDPNALFRLGNIAGNTSPASQALYLLFMREHNRRAAEIKAKFPSLSDSDIFEQARTWVISLIQKITISEYLPIILGEGLPPYKGYNAAVNPTTDAFFACCAFRYGHSEIGHQLLQSATPISVELNHTLENVLMNTTAVRTYGTAPFLVGMTKKVQQEPDIYVIRGLRNFLFKGDPVDLFANDVQRSRDFGMPSYVRIRQFFGLPPIRSFNDISSDVTVVSNLRTTYKDINLIDANVGGQCEDRKASNVGDLYRASIISQFVATRDGDRFWYENPGVLTPEVLAEVKNTTIRDLIARHIKEEITSAGRAYNDNLLSPDPWFVVDGLVTGAAPPGFVKVVEQDQFSIYSRVNGATVSVEVQCYSNGGWCGFGFGTQMADADFVIARPYSTGQGSSVLVEEYKTLGYQTRPLRNNGSAIIREISGNYDATRKTMRFRFSRPTSSAGYNTLNVNNQAFVFAFAPFMQEMYRAEEVVDKWFAQHGSNKYQFSANLNTGIGGEAVTMDTVRIIHSVIMMSAVAGILPGGIFLKRYFVGNKWTMLHLCVQSIAVAMILGGFLTILLRPGRVVGSGIVYLVHSICGMVIVGVYVVVAALGYFIRWGKKFPWKVRRILTVMHHWIARVIVLVGLGQCVVGLYQVFPLDSRRQANFNAYWITFMSLVGAWAIAYVIAELKKHKAKLFSKRSDSEKGMKKMGEYSYNNNGSINQVAPTSPMNEALSPERQVLRQMTVDSNWSGKRRGSNSESVNSGVTKPSFGSTVVGNAEEQRKVGRKMTWKDLGDAVIGGEQLIVSGRYIYDIAKWIPHHPGGTAILNTVLGTDVTNDFFNEIATFDADGMDDDHNGTLISARSKSMSVVSSKTDDVPAPASKLEQLRSAYINKDDWTMIQKARRIHQHGQNAVKKILSLLVGEIDYGHAKPSGIPMELDPTYVPPFDPFEYRRYTVSSKTLLTAPNVLSKNPVYLVRFVQLYPLSERRGEPDTEFLAGQWVEIQILTDSKAGNKSMVSRQYTPISGNIKAFDVVIKVLPGGQLTSVFEKPDRVLLGVKQFKIRGPFGTPLVPKSLYPAPMIPMKMKRLPKIPKVEGVSPEHLSILAGWRSHVGDIPMDNTFMMERWTNLLFISAGSGLSPYFQILRDHFLPENKVVCVFIEFKSPTPDMISLAIGDRVLVMKHLNNGQAIGMNLRTRQEGVFPMNVTVPLCGVKEMTGSKFTLINCVHSHTDLFGEELLAGAALASTDGILSVVHVVSHPQSPTERVERVSRNPNLMNPRYINRVVEGRRLDLEILEGVLAEFKEKTPHIIVCGPAGFESSVYALLVDEIGVEHSDVTMLPPH